jgi:RES domain-containing protein
VLAYRIGSPAHALLDGAGAAASDDARWNTRGRFVIYAAEHYATALLEKAAQLNSVRIRARWCTSASRFLTTRSRRSARERVARWSSPNKAASQQFGDPGTDERRSLILLVPALAAPGLERNVLINQRHPEFRRVTASRPDPIAVIPRCSSDRRAER